MEIKLTKGHVTLIDDEDFNLISDYKWYASITKDGHVYAKNIYKRKSLFLHRVISKAKKGDIVDHINGNTLDNRKENLRVTTHSENAFNSRNKKGRFPRGIYKYDNRNKPWFAQIHKEGVRYCLGYFYTEREALDAYNKKAVELYGEHIVKNIS